MSSSREGEEEEEEEKEGYRPNAEFMEDGKEPLLQPNLSNSTQLWLIKLPFSNDLLSEIDGKQLSLNLHKDGELATFHDLNGKDYDFLSLAAQEDPDETVFISSATQPKIAGKVSRRVDIVHYPEPEELNKRSSTNARQTQRGSTGGTATASRYFPQSSYPQSSQPGRAVSSKGSRQKSSLSEVAEPSNTPKRKTVTESSHGHSTGISALSSDHSHGGKSKRRKHKE